MVKMPIKAKAKEYFPKPTLPRYLVIIITRKKEKILSNISLESSKKVLLAIVFADDIVTKKGMIYK